MNNELYENELVVSDIMYKIVQILANTEKIKISNIDFVNSIAIYGIGKVGRAVYILCKNLGIKVDYIIDNGGMEEWDGIKVYTTEDVLPKVDMTIISPVKYLEEIKKQLCELNINNCCSAKQFVLEIYNFPLV